ncbi:acyl-CoA N-acyltransferase [Lasiosphaeria hispida]|uniref:Acyl-CoA N-acyltransferase n=1 Tax=Lasiosphaeria hispida TaxID=260671 RepID=A0AAJ0HX59_9PEZI|nr:acyl-CoA N-acyltransferase [Lasiosphaeria hispida]
MANKAILASWRGMTVDDIPQLLQVADQVHPDLPESDDVFSERAQLFPDGCLTLADDGKVYGYAVSHPIRRGCPPALDSLLGEIPEDSDQYYIHDVAVLPELRGKGHAADAINKLLEVANRFATTCLVSVYGTGPFWGRFGFEPEPVSAVLQEKLRNYGDDAVYMSRRNGDLHRNESDISQTI